MIRVDFENVDDQVIQDFTDTVRQIGNVASVELEWPEERVRQYLKDPDNIDPQTEEVLRQAASDMSVVMDVYFESEADEDVIRQEIETSAQEFNIPINEIHTDSLVWVEKKIKDASFIMATFMRGFDSSGAGGLIVDREALKACINNS